MVTYDGHIACREVDLGSPVSTQNGFKCTKAANDSPGRARKWLPRKRRDLRHDVSHGVTRRRAGTKSGNTLDERRGGNTFVWDARRTERSWVTKLPKLWWGGRGKTIGRGGFGVVVGGVVVTLFNVGMAHGRLW